MYQFDLYQHLLRQIAFSRATFGPGARTAGVIDHIRKELEEILRAPNGFQRAVEWVDVVILALDGLTRQLSEEGYDTEAAALKACMLIASKQTTNEARIWPDWRMATPDKAIMHVKDATAINNEWLEKMGSDQLAPAIANGMTVDNRVKAELWIANQGDHAVPYYYTVRVIRRDWTVTEGPASSFDWVLTGSDRDIMQYRII